MRGNPGTLPMAKVNSGSGRKDRRPSGKMLLTKRRNTNAKNEARHHKHTKASVSLERDTLE